MNTNTRRTIIRFDYGGYYTSRIDGSSLWNPKEANKTYSILFSTSKKNVTYSELVKKVSSKMGVNPMAKLLFSYISEVLYPHSASYIVDDEDVYVYLMEGAKTSALHVEIVEESERVQVEEVGRREEPCNENNIVSSLVVVPTVPYPANDIVDEPFEDHSILECNDDVENEEFGGTSNGEVYENIEDSWEDGLQFTLGQEFESKEEVIGLVARDCHQSSFDTFTAKSTTILYVVKCRQFMKGCKWSLRVAKLTNADCFSVRTYNKVHTCSRVASSTSRQRRHGTPGLVASILHDDYPGVLDTPTPKSLIGLVQGKVGVKVSYSTALRGKKQAAYAVRGRPEESYQMIHSYLYMLEKVNPGTKTSVQLDDDNKFKYLFIALGACVEGFKVMRKVIIVDACFLKTVHGGVLIFATAQDPNHHHYPIAFGVVDGEKDASWTWFMNMLKTVIPDDVELVFVSDRHRSIYKSIMQVYPLAKHGFCIYHLSQNVKNNARTRSNKNVVAEKFRECARAYSEAEFLKLYDAFRHRYPGAGEYLDGSVVEGRWARCYFPGERYNIDTTNAAEGLNSVFRNARKLSLLPLLDAIVSKISEWFNIHRKASCQGSSEQKMVPVVEKELHDTIEKAKLLKVQELNSQILEYNVIGRNGLSYYVNLSQKTCTCRRFDIDKYPCIHAAAAAMDNKEVEIPLYSLCSNYYSMELWALAYYRTIYLVPHSSQWVIPNDIQELVVYPPDYVVKKGRNQENRFRSSGEGPSRRKSKTAQ